MNPTSSTITFRPASTSDADSIAVLSERVQAALPCPDFFVISGAERIRWKLENDAFAILACDGDDVVAFHIFEVPSPKSDENLGRDVGLDESELGHVLHMDSVAVLPQYRGLGLQRQMMRMGEDEGMRFGRTVFLATVDPRNTPSVRSFLGDGYDIVLVREGYYVPGVPRAVVMKRSDGRKMSFPSVSGGVVLDAIPS